MKALSQFVLFNLILFLQINSVCSSCEMPTAWLGSWYQRGMNSLLEITIDYMQTKGLCLQVLPIQQYYLFTDQSTRCTRCLRFIQRHVNLLQYRESECNDADDLLNITSCPNMIAPDAVLYTLHRNNSKPQSCPIQPPFLLTNLIIDHSVCHQSVSSSYINECAHDYQFHLHLSPCLPSQPILDLQFVCLGTWKENLHTYFVTRLLSHSTKQQHHHHRNNQYACFRFSTQSSSLHMATDDSCHDLYSRQMSTVMTLSSKDLNTSTRQMLNQSCTFPHELQFDHWYSINHTVRMIITRNNIELIGMNKRFHCQQLISSEKSSHIYRIRTYTNCHMKDECLRIVHRTKNILELYIIPLSRENRCVNHHHHVHLTFYTNSSSVISSCPNYIGHLIYQSNIDYHLKRKFYHMSIGCHEKQNLIISNEDQDREQRAIIQIDTCRASWRSDDLLTTYLIVQSRSSNVLYCLSFQMTNPIIIRNNSHGCSFDSPEDDKSIAIYSARLIQPCSHSCRLSIHVFIRLVLLIIFSFAHFCHSKQ